MAEHQRGEIVELRVHGVHGTSPALVLGVEPGDVVQVAGDGLTGVYRSTAPLPLRDLAGLPVSVEAYSWGSLTSGVQGLLGWVKRCLWLLLLPFALANLASWARLGVGRGDSSDRRGAAVCRLAGVLLTVLLVLTPCLVAVDMVAWQCFHGGTPSCTGLPHQLDFLAGWAVGRRMAAACGVPLAAVGVLWLLSHRSLCRYEAVTSPSAGRRDLIAGPDPLRVLRSPGMWSGSRRTRRLQWLHVAAGLLTITGFVAAHVADGLTGADRIVPLTAAVLAGLGLVGVGAQVCRVHPDDPEWRAAGPRETAAARAEGRRSRLSASARATVLAAAALLAVVLGYLVWGPVSGDHPTDFWGHNIEYVGLLVLLTACHLFLFVHERAPAAAYAVVAVYLVGALGVGVAFERAGYTVAVALGLAGLVVVGLGLLDLWHYRVVRGHGAQAWRGAGASVLLAAAVWVALLFTSAAVMGTADYLDGGGRGAGDVVSSSSEALARAGDALTATGGVTVRGATVVITPDGAEVSGGRVEAGTLGILPPPGRWPGWRVWHRAEPVPRTHRLPPGTPLSLGSRTTLRLDETSIDVEDGCLVGAPTSLSSRVGPSSAACPAGGVFVATARVAVGGRHLTLAGAGGTGGPVTLVGRTLPQQPLVVPQVLVWTALAQLVWLVLAVLTGAVCVLRYAAGAGRRISRGVRAGAPTPEWRARDAGADPDPVAAEPVEADPVAAESPTADVVQLERGGRMVAAGPGSPPPWVPPLVAPPYVAGAAAGRWWAGLAHRSEAVLDALGLVTGFVGLLVPVLAATGQAPWEVLPPLRALADLSLYVAVLVALGLVVLGSSIRRSDSTRRAVGITWDLTTFWPRVAHPLAPPCYAERVVPELLQRTRWVLTSPTPGRSEPANEVVLSGHSQGSLILAAVAARLSDTELRRVHLITYGSQIRALYGRIFPAVFGADQIGYAATRGPARLDDPFPDVPAEVGDGPVAPPGTLRRRLQDGGGWTNLFRRTDPLGWRVFSDADPTPGAELDTDLVVAEVPPASAGDPGPHVLSHGAYPHTLEYRRVIAHHTGEPVVEPTLDTVDVPALPPL